MQETQETCVRSLGREDPLKEGMATHSSILPGEPHGQRSLAGYSPRVCRESDTTERLNNQMALPINEEKNDWKEINSYK